MDNTDTQATGVVTPEAQAEDTVATQTSEASESSQVAPEASQSQEDATGVNAEDTAREDKLFAGKYKTPEDLEKAYRELQSKATKDAMEKADLTKILNEAFMPPATTQDTAYDYREDDSSADDGVKRDIAVMKFTFAHPDANGEAMKEVLANDPMIKQINGHEAKLEYAYYRAQSMNQKKAIAEAQKQAQVQTQAKIAEKQTAQVETARKAESTDEVSELRERATGNYSQADRDRARKELIRKTLVNL